MKKLGDAIGSLALACARVCAYTCVQACAPSRARAVSINLLKLITYYTYLPYLKINLITYSYSYLTVRGKVRGKGEGKGKGKVRVSKVSFE
jgi:hypothetical protein